MSEKRAQVTKREYIMEDGSKAASPTVATAVSVDVIGAEATTFVLSDFPAEIQHGFTMFGMQTLLTNALGGLIKDKGPSEAFDAMMARAEALKAGTWASRGESGPRVSRLAEAVVAAFAAEGISKDLAEVTASLAADESKRKTFAAHPAVKAEYERLSAEAAKARAKAAAAAAKSSGTSLGGLDL